MNARASRSLVLSLLVVASFTGIASGQTVGGDLLGPEGPVGWTAESLVASRTDAVGTFLHAFPRITVERSARSDVRLFNPGDAIVRFTAEVLDARGSVLAARTMAVLPGQVVPVNDLGPARADSWMRINASGRLAGYCTVEAVGGASAVIELSSVAPGRTLALPRLSPRVIGSSAGLSHVASLVNPGGPAEFFIVPRDAEGRDLSAKLASEYRGPLTLASGGRLDIDYDELLAQGARAADELAWIEIHSAGALAGGLVFGHRGGDFAELAALPTEDARQHVPLFPGGEDGGFDGFTLLNSNPQMNRITVRAWSEDGTSLLTKTVLVGPWARLEGLSNDRLLRIHGGETPRGSECPETFSGRRGRRIGSLSVEGTLPFLLDRVAGRTRRLLRAGAPPSFERRSVLAVPDAEGHHRLLLQAASAGQAVVRVHSPAGRQTLARTIVFSPRKLESVELGATTPGSFVSVSSAADEPPVAVVLEVGSADGPTAELAGVKWILDELPAGDELNAEPYLYVPPLIPEQYDWVQRNHHPIASLTSGNFEDLQFLKGVIGDKRIVQLGESSHGTAEFSSAKVRLIRFLHEQMGFDVIAFESGLFECEWTQRLDPEAANAYSHLYGSIFGVWHSYEALELFEYIRLSKLTPRPLILTGFDPQASSNLSGPYRAGFIRDAVAPVDPEMAEWLYAAESEFRAHAFDLNYLQANRARLSETFVAGLGFVEAHRAEIEAARPDDPEIGKLMIAVLRDQVTRVELYWLYLTRFSEGSLLRDRAMADNLHYLADVMYPDKKIITWAHNYHIRYDEPHIRYSYGGFGGENMGYHVGQRRRDEVYTIGLFMTRGSAAFNNRVPYYVREPAYYNSLEGLSVVAGRKLTFFDVLNSSPEPGQDWIHDWFYSWIWGVYDPEQAITADNYDGLLFIDTTHPPSYTY